MALDVRKTDSLAGAVLVTLALILPENILQTPALWAPGNTLTSDHSCSEEWSSGSYGKGTQ